MTEINLDTLKKNERFLCKLESDDFKSESIKISIDCLIENDPKIIKIQTFLDNQKENMKNDNIILKQSRIKKKKKIYQCLEQTKIKFKLKKLGFSLIDSTPKEILYLQIDDLSFFFKKVQNIFDIKFTLYDFQVNFLE